MIFQTYIYIFIISYIPEGLGHLRWGRVGWGELGLGGGWGNNVHVHLKTCALLMLHMTKGQLGRHGLSRNVSDPIEHRQTCLSSTLPEQKPRTQPGVVSFVWPGSESMQNIPTRLSPVSQVFSNAPWEC